MPLHDADVLAIHGLLDEAGVIEKADGHYLPLLERVALLIAQRDELRKQHQPEGDDA